jgi:hypothetical protein
MPQVIRRPSPGFYDRDLRRPDPPYLDFRDRGLHYRRRNDGYLQREQRKEVRAEREHKEEESRRADQQRRNPSLIQIPSEGASCNPIGPASSSYSDDTFPQALKEGTHDVSKSSSSGPSVRITTDIPDRSFPVEIIAPTAPVRPAQPVWRNTWTPVVTSSSLTDASTPVKRRKQAHRLKASDFFD